MVKTYLILHPLLVVKLDILFVLASGAVGLPNRGRVVRQVGVAIVAVVLRHLEQVPRKYLQKPRKSTPTRKTKNLGTFNDHKNENNLLVSVEFRMELNVTKYRNFEQMWV